MGSGWDRGRRVAALVAVGAPFIVHAALTTGYGANVALGAAALQAVAAGLLLRPTLRPGLRALAPAVTALLLAGLAFAAARSTMDALLAATGLAHAVLYGGLLAVFAASLRPSRVAFVTRLAQRINPHFHAGMLAYTRAVTWTWCLFFAGQLLLSAALLAFAPRFWWVMFVGTLHAPLALALALAEFAVRCWRFPGQHTSFRAMLRGVRSVSSTPPAGPSPHRTGHRPR